MRGFKPYPAYKDSRVEWLGEVPEHWNVCRMAHLEQGGDDFVSGPFGSSLGSADYVDEGIPVIRGVNTTLRAERKFVEEDFVFVTEEKYADLCRCNAVPGDLIFTARGTVGKVALVPGSVPISLISPNQLRFRPRNEKVIAEYFFYMFSSENLLVEVILSSDSVAQPNMNLGSLKAIKVMLPPSCEQTQIARFLDHETARIDALIEEQQRLIELLKEKRQAVISHAVTKGLDPTVPMKDSGVEWLGEVPAHWERKRLKNISPQITVGIVVNPSEYISADGLPYLYGAEVKEGWIDLEGSRSISPDDSKKNPKTMLAAGDLVTMRVGYPGITAVVTPECEGGNCASIILIRKGKFDSHWLCAAMNSQLIRHQVELVQYGAAQKAFNVSDAVEFWLYEPPYSEQCSIANFISAQSLVFDNLITEANKSAIYLQERRSALISAAVTGKIDVRGWQPPASTQTPEPAVAEAV